MNNSSQPGVTSSALAEIKNEIKNTVLKLENKIRSSVSISRSERKLILLKAAKTMMEITN